MNRAALTSSHKILRAIPIKTGRLSESKTAHLGEVYKEGPKDFLDIDGDGSRSMGQASYSGWRSFVGVLGAMANNGANVSVDTNKSTEPALASDYSKLVDYAKLNDSPILMKNEIGEIETTQAKTVTARRGWQGTASNASEKSDGNLTSWAKELNPISGAKNVSWALDTNTNEFLIVSKRTS